MSCFRTHPGIWIPSSPFRYFFMEIKEDRCRNHRCSFSHLNPHGALPDHILRKCAYDDRDRNKVHGHLSSTCSDRLRLSGKRSHAEMSECPIDYPERYCPTNDQRHNAKGHSYLSRFLICACTSKLYKRNEAALPAILKETALEL